MTLSINNPETTQARVKSLPLSLNEMIEATDILNRLSLGSGLKKDEYELLQRMLHEYENLKHYKSVNCTADLNVEYTIVESKMNE